MQLVRSHATSSIFKTIDKDSESLKIYNGPIDFNCVSNMTSWDLIDKIIDLLIRKKISYIQTNPYKFRCSKKGVSFDIEIFRLEDEENLKYIKFKLNHAVDYSTYRRLIYSLMSNFKLFI